MAKDPNAIRRIERRVAAYNANPNPANARMVREGYTAYINDLNMGRGSFTDTERRQMIRQATAEYNKAVGLNRQLNDPSLPINSDSAIQSLLPAGSAPSAPSAQPAAAKTAPVSIPIPAAPTAVSRSRSARRSAYVPAKTAVDIPVTTSVPPPTTASDVLAGSPSVNVSAINPGRMPGILPTTSDSSALPPRGLPDTAGGISSAVANAAGAVTGQGGGDSNSLKGMDWFGTALDAAGVLAGTLGMKPLPDYQLPPEYQLYLNRVKNQSFQGLPTPQLTAANRDLQQGYATALATGRNLAGGGGSATEAAANAIDASSRYNAARLNLAGQDVAANRLNLAAYGQALGVPLAVDQGNFERQYNQTANSNNMNAALIQQSVQNLSMRPYENANQDLYDQLLRATIDRQNAASSALERKNILGVSNLQ